MRKKSGIAQDADTTQPNPNEISSEVTYGPPETPQFDLSEIEKKIPKAFRGYIKPVVQWAESVEARINFLAENMPNAEKIKVAMTEWAEDYRKKQVAAMRAQTGQQMPQGGGGSVMDMVRAAKEFGVFGGGGMDEEMVKLNKQILQASLDRMKQDTNFTEAIKNAIVTKLAGKAAGKLVE